MRKIFCFIIVVIFTSKVHSQDLNLPNPSTSSISSYVNTPSSLVTGVPDINIPIYNLDTGNPDLGVSVSLSYHIHNAMIGRSASEVGSGWSLYKGGAITRVNIGLPDSEVKWQNMTKDFADLFYYSIPGHSGKFKVYKAIGSNEMVVNNITGEKVKIECERDMASDKFVIKSFKITDDKGLQYFFTDADLEYIKNGVNNKNYKSAFVLNRILDQSDKELVNYQYQVFTEYIGTSIYIKHKYNKLSTISTKAGKIQFEYSKDTGATNFINDPYRVNTVTLLDAKDHLLSQYSLVYRGISQIYISSLNDISYVQKRILSKIIKKDKNLSTKEEIGLEYTTKNFENQQSWMFPENFGYYFCKDANKNFINPIEYHVGFLQRIISPEKGYVVYNYELNDIFFNKENLDYFQSNNLIDLENQYFEKVSIPFDTKNPSSLIVNVPTTDYGVKYFYLDIEEFYEDIHGNLKGPEIRLTDPVTGGLIVGESCANSGGVVYFQYYDPKKSVMKIYGLGKGILSYYRLKSKPKPYLNHKIVKEGVRVKKIQSFDANGKLSKSKYFDYQDFDNPINSSGYPFVDNDIEGSEDETPIHVLYRNVKVTDGNANNGYVKYYYKSPDDFMENFQYKFYNITSQGVLDKKEVYNNKNTLVEKSQFEYTFEEIPDSEISTHSKPSWTRYIKNTLSQFFSSGKTLTQVSETTFSSDNHQETLQKTTDPQNNVVESKTFYANDVNKERLITSNIISIPIEVEVKRNGVLQSKLVTNYDNDTHFFPTSIVNYDLKQNPQTLKTFDFYDDKGNLVQSTDRVGVSTVAIYGYHQSLPIATIIGAKYQDIKDLTTINNCISISNEDADQPNNEQALVQALQSLQNDPALKDFVVTGYTYNPLVGITHALAPNGLITTYEYDDFSRLISVKNHEGKVIKEYQYHIKQN